MYRAFIDDNVSYTDSSTLIATYRKSLELYDSILLSQSCDYSFSFRSPKPLKTIGFYDYNNDSLDYYYDQYQSIVDNIKRNYNTDKIKILKDYTKNENIYIIHVLYKNGIMCGRDCVSGAIVIRELIK